MRKAEAEGKAPKPPVLKATVPLEVEVFSQLTFLGLVAFRRPFQQLRLSEYNESRGNLDACPGNTLLPAFSPTFGDPGWC